MKKQKPIHPTAWKISVLSQLCNFIPNFLVPQLARETGVDKKARTFSPWSHVVCMVFAQLAHSLSLNDLCDALRLHSGPLSALRGATPPSRNNLSHANHWRDAAMAEKLFWQVLDHLRSLAPGWSPVGSTRRFAFRFKRVIHLVDATTISLVANCLDWAEHRRRKAAAKCHLRLDLQSFLPRFAVVDIAAQHDNKRAREVCAGIQAGEIVVFDKAYVDFSHLYDLQQRGVFWVTRAKGAMKYKVVRKQIQKPQGKILRDDLIEWTVFYSQKDYPQVLRRIVAVVEVNGKEVEMIFLTNNLEWSARSVAELYRCRWQIEVFFKQVKQTLQLADFLGNSANAVRWQVWTALLVYVLLRFAAFISGWAHSFARLFTLVRAVLWRKWNLIKLLQIYGTAPCRCRLRAQPQQAYLPGFG